MDRGSRPPEESRPLAGEGEPSAAAARALAREREKAEIRRERDHIVLSIARELGPEGLAAGLGTSAEVTETLLARARERLAGGRPAAAPEISARRRAAGGERWQEADRHFEELGRRAWLPGWAAPLGRRPGR